jgi:hypothetical protein
VRWVFLTDFRVHSYGCNQAARKELLVIQRVQIDGLGGYLSVEACAAKLGLTVSGMHKLLKRERIATVTLAGAVLVPAWAVRQAMMVRK